MEDYLNYNLKENSNLLHKFIYFLETAENGAPLASDWSCVGRNISFLNSNFTVIHSKTLKWFIAGSYSILIITVIKVRVVLVVGKKRGLLCPVLLHFIALWS